MIVGMHRRCAVLFCREVKVSECVGMQDCEGAVCVRLTGGLLRRGLILAAFSQGGG